MVHALHVHGRGHPAEAVAEVEQQHAARSQNAALEAAAGANIAVEYDVKAENERKRQIAVRKAPDDEVVAFPSLVHLPSPHLLRCLRSMTVAPVMAMSSTKLSPRVS